MYRRNLKLQHPLLEVRDGADPITNLNGCTRRFFKPEKSDRGQATSEVLVSSVGTSNQKITAPVNTLLFYQLIFTGSMQLLYCIPAGIPEIMSQRGTLGF